jgi:SPP1 gp7 family putative phage head morphogenesis protein
MPSIYDNQFWLEEEDSLWEDLAEIIIGALLAGVEGGAAILPANAQALVDFDLVNTSVIDYAKKYRYELIKGITDTTRTQTQKLVSDWVLSGQPLGVLETQLAPIFGEVRAGMIAQTESTRVYFQGASDSWESTGLVSQWQYMTVEDSAVCPICEPLDGQVFDMDDTEHYPPQHINCRCFGLPLLDEQAFEESLDEILA